MGVATQPKTNRNLMIYVLWKSGKKTRADLMKRFNISIRRFYQIVNWSKKVIDEKAETKE